MKRIILLGYGQMGPYALTGLASKFEILAVVVPSDGRLANEATARTETLAKGSNITVFKDKGLKELHDFIQSLSPDAVVIATYDKVLPERTLQLTKYINVHHGSLPKYRGRANFNWAIINGLDSLNVTVHEVLPGLDEGGIYASWPIPLLDDYIGDVYDRINHEVEHSLPGVVEEVLNGELKPVPQTGEATYCCTRIPEDSKIDWSKSAEEIHRLIRASSRPFPGAFTDLNGERLTVWRAELNIPSVPPRNYVGNIPGRVGRVLKGIGVEVLTGTSPIIITSVNMNGSDCRADEIIKSISTTLC